MNLFSAKAFLPCLFFLLGTSLTWGAGAGKWEAANQAFAAGRYQEALQSYQDVIRTEGHSAARLYNLGNTLAKLEQTGPAVLAYEQAALLAPRDPNIQNNLQLIRPANPALSPAPPEWYKSPLFWLSLHEWSWLTLAGTGLFSLAALAMLILPNRDHRFRRFAPQLLGAGAAFAILGGLALHQRWSEKNLAILLSPEPTLRLSPFATADPIPAATATAGQRVIPGPRQNGWLHVSVPNTQIAGWIPETEVSKIIP